MYGSQSGRAWKPPISCQTWSGVAGTIRLTEVDAMGVS